MIDHVHLAQFCRKDLEKFNIVGLKSAAPELLCAADCVRDSSGVSPALGRRADGRHRGEFGVALERARRPRRDGVTSRMVKP